MKMNRFNLKKYDLEWNYQYQKLENAIMSNLTILPSNLCGCEVWTEDNYFGIIKINIIRIIVGFYR